MNELVNTINGVIWSPALIFLCLGVGLYFSLRGRFLQIRHLKEMLKLMFTGKTDEHGVSSFQALTMTLAGRVGTGNIAGVATAITFGGPGAVFWMWMVAFLGASSAFVESTLGQVYKEKIDGQYRGGPAFYIEKGLGMKWYAWIFAIATIIACGLLLPGVQANSIASSVEMALGIHPNTTAAVLAIMWGVKRGVYSNEAGQGTGPHASSAAAVSHPAKQGLVQAFSVYIDTLFVCSATAFMLLITGQYNVQGPNGDAIFTGIAGVAAGPGYVQTAMENIMPGFGSVFVAVALFFFAFTTIVAYYYIAETNIAYINRKVNRPWLTVVLKFALIAATVYGTIKTADLAWGLGDIGVGLMAWLNIIAIILMHKTAFVCLRDYEAQQKLGLDPVFHPEKLGIKNADYWGGHRSEDNLQAELAELGKPATDAKP